MATSITVPSAPAPTEVSATSNPSRLPAKTVSPPCRSLKRVGAAMRRLRAMACSHGANIRPTAVTATTTPIALVSHSMRSNRMPTAISTTTAIATGMLPIHSRRTTCQSTLPPRWWMATAANLVSGANHRSVATAVAGAMPKNRMRMGVISAPPPTPVSPTTHPVTAPAMTNDPSIILRTPRRRGQVRDR